MRDRLWTKDFTIDVCINFLLYVIMYQLMLWSTQFAIHTWDATVSEAGLASGIFIIGALSSRIVTGHVIDALGRKKALLVGTGIYMAGLLLYFPVHSLTAFLVIRCLHGAAYGISATAASTIVGAIVPPKRRGEGIGYYALGNTLASAAGPFLGMTLCSGGNYYLNVYVCIGLAVLTFALAAAIHSPEHVCTAADRAALKSLRWDSFISVQALPISIISFFCGIGYSTVLSFIGAYTNSLNLAIAGSIFFCTYSVTSFFSRPIIGRFLDHHGGDAVMYPTLAILALCPLCHRRHAPRPQLQHRHLVRTGPGNPRRAGRPYRPGYVDLFHLRRPGRRRRALHAGQPRAGLRIFQCLLRSRRHRPGGHSSVLRPHRPDRRVLVQTDGTNSF